jgi:hypothetical protein
MQEIPRESLVPGKEYYLQCFEPVFAPPNKPYKMIAKFENLKPSLIDFMWACFSDFRSIKNKNSRTRCNVALNHNWRFYEISQHGIQKSMENRAYNMVLLDLIKDEYFSPVDVL